MFPTVKWVFTNYINPTITNVKRLTPTSNGENLAPLVDLPVFSHSANGDGNPIQILIPWKFYVPVV